MFESLDGNILVEIRDLTDDVIDVGVEVELVELALLCGYEETYRLGKVL